MPGWRASNGALVPSAFNNFVSGKTWTWWMTFLPMRKVRAFLSIETTTLWKGNGRAFTTGEGLAAEIGVGVGVGDGLPKAGSAAQRKKRKAQVERGFILGSQRGLVHGVRFIHQKILQPHPLRLEGRIIAGVTHRVERAKNDLDP